MIDHDNGITNFHFEICAELLDDSCLKVIAAARRGLFQFEIGIQSCSGQTLEAVDRRGDVDLTPEKGWDSWWCPQQPHSWI